MRKKNDLSCVCSYATLRFLNERGTERPANSPVWNGYRQLSRLNFAWDVAGTRAGRGCRCQSLANPYTVWKELTFTSVSTLHPHRLFNQQFFSFWTGARPLWAQTSQVDAAQQKDHRGPVYSCRQQPVLCVRGRVKNSFLSDHRKTITYIFLLLVWHDVGFLVGCCLASFFLPFFLVVF